MINISKNKIICGVLILIVLIICEIISVQIKTYKLLSEASTKINKDLPTIINDDLRLDSTKALKWNNFAYHYTFYNHSLDDFDLENFEENLKDKLIDNARTNAFNNGFNILKTDILFIFSDKEGKKIKDIKIKYSEYK
jgi:hypothetical protein